MSHTDEVQSKLQHLRPIQNTKDVQLQHVHKLESFISQQCKRINHPFAFFCLFFLFACTLLTVTVLCICIRITPCDVYLFRFTCALLVPFYKESKCFDPLRITSMNPRNYLLFYVHNALVHSFFEWKNNKRFHCSWKEDKTSWWSPLTAVKTWLSVK